MDRNVSVFLSLIRETLNGIDEENLYDYSNADWNAVVNLAVSSGMLGIVYKRLKNISQDDEELKGIFSSFDRLVLAKGIAEVRKKNLLKGVLKEARENGVPVLVFKGVVLSELYPEPGMRFSSDTDMFIEKSERPRMIEILERRGYFFDEGPSHDDEVKYYIPGQHYVELHSKLWSYVRGTKIDMLEQMKLTDKRIHGVFDGVECDTIDYSEQLIFLMYHLYKHLMFDRANIRFLTDIILFFYAHYNEMNLKIFKDRMVFLEYWNFFSQMYEIGVRYLGFKRLPAMEELGPAAFDEKAAESTVRELMLLEREDFDEDLTYKLTYNLMPYLTGDHSAKEESSKVNRKLAYLFPSAKDFSEEYGYVKKCPILLPIGWIHRIIKYSFCRLFKREEKMSAIDRMDKVDEKISRLREMGLFE